MQIKGKIPLAIVAALAWVVAVSSCANIGMPTGGPKDTVPPMVLETHPDLRALNYGGDQVQFTFNEYVTTEDIAEALVVSPPLGKRPIIRTKSKTLIIEFNEELRDSVTYSLDFKNSVADNNEKNPIENMRFSFSTGPVFDSLRVAGRVMGAFNLEPAEKGLVVLHENLHDSAVYTVKPSYIAKTDENGMFLIDNIAPGKYHIFSMNDANSDLLYNEGAEEMAFVDSLIVPSAEFHEDLDTLVSGMDSLLVMGHTHFSPEPIYLRQFTEDIFEQYLSSYDRPTRYKTIFVFNESVADTFALNVLNAKASNWHKMEYGEEMDSLVVWLADTTLARMDTLLMEVSYFQMDTANQLFVKNDTLELTFTDKPKAESKKRKKEKDGEEAKPEPVEQFTWETNAGGTIELNQSIKVTAPEPLAAFDSTKIKLFVTNDTLKAPLDLTFRKDTSAWRTYILQYGWEPETGYTLEIDSAAAVNIFGIGSRKLSKKITSRDEDYYGTVKLDFTNVEMNMVVQLLKNSDDETVVAEKEISADGSLLFDYLPPEKYKMKVIYDRNSNGKWDTGSYQEKTQPERVSYINEVVKVRSNWDKSYIWDLVPDPTFVKKIRDLEQEEKERKEAEEKALKEAGEKNSPQQMQNMFEGGGGGGTNLF